MYVVRLPAAFEEFFSETGIADGTDVGTPSKMAAHQAWAGSYDIKAGRAGRSWILTGTREALEEIREVARFFLSKPLPKFTRKPEERSAARLWIARINVALRNEKAPLTGTGE